MIIPEEIFILTNLKGWEGIMAETPSVQFIAPPMIEMQETIIKHVTPFMDAVTAAGKRGGIFTVLTKDDQGRMIGNAVVAVKVGENVEIAGYIGKTWGTKDGIVYGVESRIFF